MFYVSFRYSYILGSKQFLYKYLSASTRSKLRSIAGVLAIRCGVIGPHPAASPLPPPLPRWHENFFHLLPVLRSVLVSVAQEPPPQLIKVSKIRAKVIGLAIVAKFSDTDVVSTTKLIYLS